MLHLQADCSGILNTIQALQSFAEEECVVVHITNSFPAKEVGLKAHRCPHSEPTWFWFILVRYLSRHAFFRPASRLGEQGRRNPENGYKYFFKTQMNLRGISF